MVYWESRTKKAPIFLGIIYYIRKLNYPEGSDHYSKVMIDSESKFVHKHFLSLFLEFFSLLFCIYSHGLNGALLFFTIFLLLVRLSYFGSFLLRWFWDKERSFIKILIVVGENVSNLAINVSIDYVFGFVFQAQ